MTIVKKGLIGQRPNKIGLEASGTGRDRQGPHGKRGDQGL
jgi:hypothetical protein